MITSVFLVLLLGQQLCSAILNRTEQIVLIICPVLTYFGDVVTKQSGSLFFGCIMRNRPANHLFDRNLSNVAEILHSFNSEKQRRELTTHSCCDSMIGKLLHRF